MMSPPFGSTPTDRELQVLFAVCRPGGSVRSAAHELGISSHTARHTLRRLYERLGVNSAAQAVHAIHELEVPQRASTAAG